MITSDELIKINDWLINKGFRIRVNLTGSNWNYDIYKLDENYRKYKKVFTSSESYSNFREASVYGIAKCMSFIV